MELNRAGRIAIACAGLAVVIGVGAAAGAALNSGGGDSVEKKVVVHNAAAIDSTTTTAVADVPVMTAPVATSAPAPVTDTVPLDQRVGSLEGRVTTLEQGTTPPAAAAPSPPPTTLMPCVYDAPGYPTGTLTGGGHCLDPNGQVVP
jgi:hypothetical protein